jgi:outer membrane protein assembly factor BamB
MDGKWHLSAFDIESGQLAWLTRLRGVGCWGPVPCGRHLVVLSRDGHLAVFNPAQEVKVWEGRIPGTYHQPPAVGGGMLLAASSTDGLIAFDIDPFYEL